MEFQQKYLLVPKVLAALTARVDDLGLKLPPGWSEIPVHRTPLNCWKCGRFGRDPEQITPTELKLGWVIDGKPDAPTAVYCPDCGPETDQDSKSAPAQRAAKSSRRVQIEKAKAQLASEAKRKAKGKGKGKGKK